MSVSVSTSQGNTVDVSVSGGNTVSLSQTVTTVSVAVPSAPSFIVTEKGPKGDTGSGVASGGAENQFLQKNSATDYDTKWSAYSFPAADGEDDQVLVTDGAGALTFDHVRSTRITIRNDEGATIPAGTPVYSRGEVGGSERILVGIADASDPAKMPAIGIAETTLTTTGDTKDGYAIMSGVFNTNVSGFTGLSEGDILYVSNSGGGLSQTKPTGTYLIQNVGIVLKTNSTILQGFQVSCIGRTNDVPNIPTGNIWAGNTSSVATATSVAYIDIANSRVGIGTVTPTETLHVVGGCKIEGNFRADAIEINGRSQTSPSAGEYGAGSKIVTQFATGTVTAGVVYVASSSAWVQGDADVAGASIGMIAVATDEASANSMLIEGVIKLSSNAGFSGASAGDVLYLSNTAGELTATAPSGTGDYVRVCGYVVNASQNEVFFSPSKEWRVV
jgi:hypothetical protein